jgi:RNA polymerase sigma factor (sigma-70 family)
MPSAVPAAVVNRLRTLVAAGELEGRPDAELVERFARRRDEAAFEALVRRHGPMVLRLCRRLLPGEADAEDVFQAAFLVLARRAGSLKKTGSVGPWLYGVAGRLAAKAKAAARRRRARDAKAPVRPAAVEALDEMSAHEAERVLHEELGRLPARYRDPLVLCYLEGRTRDEAARALRCPLGTLKERLTRARELLHARLVRRGVAPATALAAHLLTEAAGTAAVAEPLARATVAAAAGAARVAPGVRALAGTLGTGRLKLAAGLVAATLLVGATAGLTAFGPTPAAPAEPTTLAVEPEQPAPVKEEQRADAKGDALPDGAVKRLGTLRHRVQTWPLPWLPLPDGKSYLTAHRAGGQELEIRRIDYATGLPAETWKVPPFQNVVGFSPDGRQALLSNGFVHYTGLRPQGQKEEQEWSLVLFDLATRKEVWANRKMLDINEWIRVDTSRFSPDGKWVVTGGQYGESSVRLWDGATGAERWGAKLGKQSFNLLGFAGEKYVVLRGQNDGHITLLDIANGNLAREFATAPLKEYPGNAVLAPDGAAVVIGGYDPKPRVWSLEGKVGPALDGHTKWARQVVFAPDGKTLFTGGNDDFLLERDWLSGKVRRRIELGRTGVSHLQISGDGKRLELLFWGEEALTFIDLATGKPLPDAAGGHRAGVYGIATMPDGKLISTSGDATVRTWDPKTGAEVARFPVEQDLNGYGFALSDDGRLVAVPRGDVKGLHVYECATGKRLRSIEADHGSMRQLFFAPGSRYLAAIDTQGGSAQVWDLRAEKRVLYHKVPQVSYAVAGAFSPDAATFAFAEHGLVRLWDTATWKERPGFENVYAPFGLAYSPDGRTLATASVEGVRLYEVATKKERALYRPNYYATGAMKFSRDGRFLAWVCDRTKVCVVDVRTGELIGPLAGHDDTINALTFTGGTLATGSADSTILLWDTAGAAARLPEPNGDTVRSWQALAGEDAKAAYEAMRALAASPAATIRRVRERVTPAAPLDEKWLAERFRNLDAPKFADRDRATRDLEALGERVAPALETFLAGLPTAEARDRAARILDKVRGPRGADARALQLHRALEVLERIGTAEARGAVEAVARGDGNEALQRDARATLGRWGK